MNEPIPKNRETWTLTLVVLVNVGLALSAITIWFQLAHAGEFWRADFTYHYNGWRIAFAGNAGHLYDVEEQRESLNLLLAQYSDEPVFMAHNYPPHSLLILSPLAYLPLMPAFYVWSAIQLGLLAIFFRQTSMAICDWSAAERWLAYSGIVAFPPILACFQLGAFSLFAAVCINACILDLKAGRYRSAGLWIILASIKPQLVVLPALVLITSRYRRIAGTMIISLFFAFWVSSFWLGWDVWIRWSKLMLLGASQPEKYGFGNLPEAMYSLRGVLTVMLGQDHSYTASRVTWLCFVIAGALLARRSIRNLNPQISNESLVSMALISGVLFGPHLFKQDCLVVILPAILLFDSLVDRTRTKLFAGRLLATAPIAFYVDQIASDATTMGIPVLWLASYLILALIGFSHSATRT